MRLSLPRPFRLRLISITAVFLLVTGINTFAQSSDARFPTPVSANEIVDSIAARDLGDSRLTDYFYTFMGLPGDLLIILESKNLNGDLDIFTAGELRPLTKITFYAESQTSSTKNIYLRKRESLILRVEARTPNDDPGTYRIRFSGSFQPISGSALVADSEKPAETNKDSAKTSDRKTTKVSSVGARIEAPVNTTDDMTKDSAKDSANNKPAEATNNKPRETESPEAANATDKSGGEGEKSEDTGSKPAPTRGAGVRKTPARSSGRKPASQPENRARLVIEERDGTRREFLMSNVRKVTVENGEILVEANDGYIESISMTKVARMSIGP